VGNDVLNLTDILGQEIASECRLNEKFDALKIPYNYEKINIDGKDLHIYRDGAPSANEEIIRLMIKFEHTFVFNGDAIDTCWNKVIAHVEMRKKKIDSLRKIANMKFGVPNIPAGIDPIQHPEKCTTDCGGVLAFIYKVGGTRQVRSSYFIPGDSGYIANTNHKFHFPNTGMDNRPFTPGENISYLGNNIFFGHIPGEVNNKYKSLSNWEKFVDGWGGHDTWDYRETVTEGTDAFIVKPGLRWNHPDDRSPYQNGDARGKWMKVEWPKQ
jgi:hypothetical protein